MKILTAEQIKNVDIHTVVSKGISSHALMEKAARSCFEWLLSHFSLSGFEGTFYIFCGRGNNGGDGLALARMLHKEGYRVATFIVAHTEKASDDNRQNEELLVKSGADIHFINNRNDIPEPEGPGVIIDAILGTGLSKSPEGIVSDVVYKINDRKSKGGIMVISVDIPTGLFADQSSGNNKYVVNADYTLSFELPKLAFMMPENSQYTGEWEILPIGLDKEFIDSQDSSYYYADTKLIKSLLRKRPKFSHKGDFGHAFLLTGSYGKTGASVLMAKACLRAGAGLVTVYLPGCGYNIIQSCVPEAMAVADENPLFLTSSPRLSGTYNVIGAGPGIGTKEETQQVLKNIIQYAPGPLVIDADAINILSENKTWLHFVPAQSIYTPHPKEFERLAGKWNDDFERLRLQVMFSVKYGVYVVLKGAHTSVTCPDGRCYFNSTGNPGMATAGSGDVLTGIITGLKAQGYGSGEAAIMGVYLHGLAGDIALRSKGENSLIAGDIIEALPEAFLTAENY